MSSPAPAPVKAAHVPRPAAKPALTPARAAVLQRKCGCGTSAEGKCNKCDEEGKTLQRSPAGHQSTPASAPPIIHDVLNSPGRPLDAATRAFMEPRFGRDFSDVRVHDDPRAAESARAVDARAYTVGQHIAFDRGQYAPHTESGRHLLAHELAHTVQQGGLQRMPAAGALAVSSEGDASEREASATADAVMRGARPAIAERPSALSLHRAPWGKCPDGERVSAVPETVNQKAELAVVQYYESVAANKAYVLSNRKPIEAFFPNPPPKHAKMLKGMEEMFRSERPGFIKRTETVPLEEAGEVAAPEAVETAEGEVAGASALGAIEGRERAIVEPEPEHKRPDIADLETREVYDVTTIGQADAKVAKIAQTYVDKLNRIREYFKVGGREWKAGTSLKRPPANILLYQGVDRQPPAICFGLTDFTLRPGVVVYEAINLPPGAAAAVTEPYEIATKTGKKAIIDANFAPSATDLLNTGPNNMASARIIRGLVLKTLKRGKTPAQDRITACVVSQGCIETSGQPAIPIAITSNQGEIELKVDAKTRVISLAKPVKGFRFRSKHLSEGTITSFDIDSEEGVKGAGKLKPSLSIFKGVEFGIEFSEDRYAITAGLEEEKLKKLLKPLPGVKMTKAQLALELFPEFGPKGELAFEVGVGKRKILDGAVVIKRGDDGGLMATGDFTAYVPGVEPGDAKGKVTYAGGNWSAVVNIKSTQLKIPGVTGGEVTAGFNERGPFGEGTVDLEVPGGHKATVGLKYAGQRWEFRGKGVFKIPKLDPTTVYISYDGENFYGEGDTGFTFQGLRGKFKVKYAAKPGAARARIWGEGSLDFTKGKAKGNLTVKLSEKGKFSGSGSVSFTLKEGIIASGGIMIDEEEKVTVTGSLVFPPYTVFKKFPDPPPRFDILPKKDFDFPIPGASIGPIGLKARISAGIYASYSIGPGLITNGFIKTKFNPLEENPDLDIEAGGTFQVNAEASLTGYLCGSLVVDALLAEVGGGIGVSATGLLKGFVASNLKARYYQGKFEASADLDMGIKLLVIFDFFAFAWASAGVWKFKVTTGKTWDLGTFTYDPGLQLGLKLLKPLSYSSERGFDVPSLDDIKWVTPTFDPKKALTSGFDRGAGPESEGKPRARPCAQE